MNKRRRFKAKRRRTFIRQCRRPAANPFWKNMRFKGIPLFPAKVVKLTEGERAIAALMERAMDDLYQEEVKRNYLTSPNG